MTIGIGTTLRETRNRRKVSLEEVKGATKIRIRYLRALENEEWDALPGSAYTRGFIKTYASYLGLDGERLAEEYRRTAGSPLVERAPRVEPASTPDSRRGKGGDRVRVLALALVAGLIAVAVVIGLVAGGNQTSAPSRVPKRKRDKSANHAGAPAPHRSTTGVSVKLDARAEVWVCLVSASGNHLIDGQILEAGAEEGPFHSSGFTVSFGNGEVNLRIDGSAAEVPVTSSPIGYRIDPGGSLTQLSEAERPTCA